MTEALTPMTDWPLTRRTGSGRVAFVALAAFTFVLLLAPQAIFPQLAPLRIALLAVGAAILSCLAARHARGQAILVLPRGTWPALALGMWALATAPLSEWPGGSVNLFLDLYVKSLVILWLIPQIVDTPDRLRRLVAWMCALGAVLAGTAISHYMSGDFTSTAGDVNRIAGYDAPLTSNPNDLALTLNMLLPLTAALVAIYTRPIVRAALIGLCVLEAAAVIATFSRAGFITLGLIGVIHAWRSLRGWKRMLVPGVLACGLLGTAVFPSGYVDHLTTSVNIQADTTGSAQARWDETLAAADAVWDQPLVGHGLGMNVLAVNAKLEGDWHSVHDVYLQYAADLGLPGLVLFLILVVGCVRAVRAVARESADSHGQSELRPLAIGIELSLWAFLVEAAFHPAGYHFYIYFFGGLALAARAIHDGGAAGRRLDGAASPRFFRVAHGPRRLAAPVVTA